MRRLAFPSRFPLASRQPPHFQYVCAAELTPAVRAASAAQVGTLLPRAALCAGRWQMGRRGAYGGQRHPSETDGVGAMGIVCGGGGLLVLKIGQVSPF